MNDLLAKISFNCSQNQSLTSDRKKGRETEWMVEEDEGVGEGGIGNEVGSICFKSWVIQLKQCKNKNPGSDNLKMCGIERRKIDYIGITRFGISLWKEIVYPPHGSLFSCSIHGTKREVSSDKIPSSLSFPLLLDSKQHKNRQICMICICKQVHNFILWVDRFQKCFFRSSLHPLCTNSLIYLMTN